MATFSAAPESSGLRIKWGDGWVEDFPETEFLDDCVDQPRRIWMYHDRWEKCRVEYSLTVKGAHAYLDYGGRFSDANSKRDRDIFIGVTEIRFTDSSRSVVKAVLWKNKQAKAFKKYDGIFFSWENRSRKFGPFILPKDDVRQHRVREIVIRPGQTRFREDLVDRYGAHCCVTGCELEETLEAAHIVPFRGPSYDHPGNGLILRADIHRLFDALKLSVVPETLRLRLGATIRKNPDYKPLDGSELDFGRTECRPDPLALGHHWRRFSDKHHRS